MKYYIFSIIMLIISSILILYGYSHKKENKVLKTYVNKVYKIFMTVFILILFLLVFYKYGIIPYGMHVDEAGMLYDARLLANYGIDRYFNKLPVYLINYGGGQSAMYAYLSALFIKIFGYNTIFMRLPAAILRIVSFISCYFIIKNEKDKIKRLIFMFLLLIFPYFIMQSRWGLDCNLLVSFMSIAVSFLVNAILKNNNKLLLFSGIFFGLSLYTYALSYIILPIFLLITIIYLLYLKKINIKKILIFGIPVFILAIPLMLMILVNNEIINEIKGIITIPKIPYYRGAEISLSNIKNNLYILISIISYDYSTGIGEYLPYNAIPEFGTIYYMSIPFVFIGFITCYKKAKSSLKEKKWSLDLLFLCWFLSVLVCLLLIRYPNINKGNAIFIPLVYFASVGFIWIIEKNNYLIVPLSILLLINFSCFSYYYFYKYNYYYNEPPYFATNYLDALNYCTTLETGKIYVYPNLASQEYIYLYATKNTDRYKFNTSYVTINNNEKEQNYIFNIPQEFDYDSAYIMPANEAINIINKYDFNVKEFNNIYVLSK